MATNLQPPVSHLGSLLAYLDYWLGAGSTGPLPSCSVRSSEGGRDGWKSMDKSVIKQDRIMLAHRKSFDQFITFTLST